MHGNGGKAKFELKSEGAYAKNRTHALMVNENAIEIKKKNAWRRIELACIRSNDNANIKSTENTRQVSNSRADDPKCAQNQNAAFGTQTLGDEPDGRNSVSGRLLRLDPRRRHQEIFQNHTKSIPFERSRNAQSKSMINSN